MIALRSTVSYGEATVNAFPVDHYVYEDFVAAW
jgi:hypothetical protein